MTAFSLQQADQQSKNQTISQTCSSHDWPRDVESSESCGSEFCDNAHSRNLDGIELPRTPSPPHCLQLSLAALGNGTNPNGTAAECKDGSSPDNYSTPVDGGLLAAMAHAWAAEQRALAAETALEFAWARTAEAEAKASAAERSSVAHASRVKVLEAQLAAAGVPTDDDSPCFAAQPTGAASEPGTLHPQSSRSSIVELDTGDYEPASMALWPPTGLSGGSINWAYEVAAADALPSQEDLMERLQCLEVESDLSSVKLAAAIERMGAMTDMLRGCATIAFGGSDLSARRIRHHMFQTLDADSDGFLGEADLEHWYRINEVLLETNGYEAVSMEQVRQQLTDALHNSNMPAAFASEGKVSMLQLNRSKMGAGVVSIILNLDNMMQDRSSAEWGATNVVSI